MKSARRQGRLDKALDQAKAKSWTVASMKDDWKQVFLFENSKQEKTR